MPDVRNWARNQSCTPVAVHRPTTTAAVSDIVATAAAAGRRIKVIGAGHSFTAVAMTDGELLSLERMNAVLQIDRSERRVRVQAGITLADLGDALAAAGLALPNLGDINVQSIAGAIATATHGTGLSLGNLATTVVGLELVDGTGEVLRADATSHPEVLRVARVSVGAMGVVTEVTLQCVDAFNLHAHETVERFGDLVADIEGFTRSADHAEFFWFPGHDRVQAKRNRRTDEPSRPPSRLAYLRDKYLVENVAVGAACRLGRRFPSLVPKLTTTVVDNIDERELVDRSDRVFASPRKVRFVEMEYGIPLGAVGEALERVGALHRSLHHPVLLPVEVRCSAADDIPLSTGTGRTNGWIAVHQYPGMPYEYYFRGVESIMDDYGGRPHWGKLHFQTADTLRDRYPDWEAAMRVRDQLDPEGIFANDELGRVLGVVTTP